MAKDKGIKIIGNLEDAYRRSNRIALVSVVGFFVMTGVSVYLYFNLMKNVVKDKMIVLVSDYSTKYLPDKKSHLIGHCTNFHKLFFQIDEFNYNKNIKQAYALMVNKEANKLVEFYASNDWFKTIQMSNISVGLDIDSTKINTFNQEKDQYEVTFYSTQKIRSKNEIQERLLVTNMKLKSVTNTPSNPFGLLIYDFVILDNNNIRRTNLKGETIAEIQ